MERNYVTVTLCICILGLHVSDSTGSFKYDLLHKLTAHIDN